jgi:hypothetical protein
LRSPWLRKRISPEEQYLKGVLDKPAIPLFKQLKDAVEAAQKAQKSEELANCIRAFVFKQNG